MKKYITVAALLAAGTAFAGAAELVAQWDDFSDLKSDLGSANLTVDLGTSSSGASIVDGNLAVAAVSSKDARANVDLSSAGIKGSGFTLVMSLSGFSTGANKVIADMVYEGTGSAAGEKGYGFGQGNASNVAWCLNREGTLQRTGTDYWTITPDSNEHTFVFTFDASGNVELYVDNVIRQRAVVDGTYVNDGTNFTKLVLGGYGDHDGASCSFSLSKMALYSGVLSTSDIQAGNVYVPEPSAFGMLAGLGALALVASRRRRK